MGAPKVPVLAGVTLLLSWNVCQAAQVDVFGDDSIVVDSVEYNLVSSAPDYSGIMWEADANGVYKPCLCSMVSFRALQAIERYLDLSGLVSGDIAITTGWNTDGPERVYHEIMGWEMGGDGFSYASSITDFADLAIPDAWYTFSVDGYGAYRVSSLLANYSYADNIAHAGYHLGWDMFDYRSAVQHGIATNSERNYFQTVIRPQVAGNLTDGASFDVAPVPEPATTLLLGLGLAGLAAMERKRRKKSR